MPINHFKGKNIWILKPTGLNRGKGIHVVDNIKQIKKIIIDTCIENCVATKPIGKEREVKTRI
jgi:phosphoribosylamine-glycine ligase